MKKIALGIFLFITSITTAAYGCSACAHSKNPSLHKAKVHIQSFNPKDPIEGVVYFEEVSGGLIIKAKIWNAPKGKHGFHIHEFGDLSQKGQGAGGHFNPNRAPHGYAVTHNFFTAHAGDLGNIEVGEDGRGELELMVPELSLVKGKYAVAGRSIIIHDQEDDFSQPTGNAGARIAGGAIFLVNEWDEDAF